MKHLIAAALLCLATVPAFAEEPGDDPCANMGIIAAGVMTLRQAQMSPSEQIALAADQVPKMQEFNKLLVMEAYKIDAFMTEEMQQRAVADFRSSVEMSCYTAQAEAGVE